MSFLTGFAKAFGETQERKFREEQSEAEREYAEQVMQKQRAWAVEDRDLQLQQERALQLYKAWGGGAKRSGSGGGGDSENTQAAIDFVKSNFLDVGETDEEKAQSREFVAQAIANPAIANQLFKHYQGVMSNDKAVEQYNPSEIIRGANIYGLTETLESYETPDFDAASQTLEGTLEALGNAPSERPEPVVVFPQSVPTKPEDFSEQVKSVDLMVSRMVQKDQEAYPDQFNKLQILLDDLAKGSAPARAKLYSMYGNEIEEILEQFPEQFNNWRQNSNLVDLISREDQEEASSDISPDEIEMGKPTPIQTEETEIQTGTVVEWKDGSQWEFLGGNPSDPSSWKKVN